MRKSTMTGFGQYPDSVFKEQDSEDLHPQMVKQARRSGQLNLSGRGMVSVPDKVWSLMEFDEEESKQMMAGVSMDSESSENWWDTVDMTKLILACNKISSISPKISNLLGLQILDLHDNQLESLPDSVSALARLTKLNLSHNRLTSLPPGIYDLLELHNLSASNNQIEAVDERIADLNRLVSLDLAHNKLKSLPGSLGFLSKVTSLNLASNCLESIPPEISSMASLASLDLTNNKLKEVPESLRDLGHLGTTS